MIGQTYYEPNLLEGSMMFVKRFYEGIYIFRLNRYGV